MNWEVATIIAGGFSTLAIYSFLIKENPFYRLFEHLFIGIAAGLLPVLTMKNFLWPEVFSPMLGFNAIQFPDGTYQEEPNRFYLLYLIPVLFGLLYYFIFSRRYGWLAKLVIGFSLGYTATLYFKGFFTEMIPQVISSFKPLVVLSEGAINWGDSINNLLFVITLVSVMYYFFFSFRAKKEGQGKVSMVGRWLMMVCFGAFFGSTVMARMALLVERVQFLIGDWAGAMGQVF